MDGIILKSDIRKPKALITDAKFGIVKLRLGQRVNQTEK